MTHDNNDQPKNSFNFEVRQRVERWAWGPVKCEPELRLPLVRDE